MSLNSIKIQNEIDKFLKFKENIESASPATLEAYRRDLFQIFKTVNSSEIELELTESELLSYIRSSINIWGELKASSRNRKISALKSFSNFLFLNNLTTQNISNQLVTPRVPQKIPHFISVDEVVAILNYFKATPPKGVEDIHTYYLFLLLYGCGLRISEACQIQLNDFENNFKNLRITGKGSKVRLIAVTPILTKILLKNQINEQYLFGNKPLSRQTGHQYIKKLGSKVQLLLPLHPHALRHSFATHLLGSGANLRVIQQLLGHDSLQATQKYIHLNIDQLARTLEANHPLGKKLF